MLPYSKVAVGGPGKNSNLNAIHRRIKGGLTCQSLDLCDVGMAWQRLKERVFAKRPKVAGNQLQLIQGEREIMNSDDLMR